MSNDLRRRIGGPGMVLQISDGLDEPAVVGSAALGLDRCVGVITGPHSSTDTVFHRATVCAPQRAIPGATDRGPEATNTMGLNTLVAAQKDPFGVSLR